ncbi:hypothetical protein McanMca71_006883 [Microsporum canis]|uniref:2EXR domain-containing protein n=1 Tax=Arthroderma otae (strain ATCC MYA-4605 / CBS 113480) TaxID=554155 RepID=C5FQ37_ARTOC|nr:uncharacterized protein MCYG_04809 [Microsporum canis CBS 113480]EEQ31990.1 predicted protein [Microsporum canis CBS 113480]
MQALFPQFGKLPVELQVMIWEAAYHLSAPQVIEANAKRRYTGIMEANEVEYDENGEAKDKSGNRRIGDYSWIRKPYSHGYRVVFPWARTQVSAPGILAACSGSREVALRLGGFSTVWFHHSQETPQKIWFNFSSDIVFLNEVYADVHNREWSLIGNRGSCTRIRHLAVEWSLFHHTYSFRYESERHRWIYTVSNLCMRFPVLTDLYIFVPAVRNKRNLFYAKSDVHPEEPMPCEGLPIILKPVKKAVSEEVELPECYCPRGDPNKPTNLRETITEVETNFNSEWLRKGVQEETGHRPMPNFPPRIHPRLFLRKGLKPDDVRNEDSEE